MRKIEAAAGCKSGACMTSVFVPLSRSLQRMAAAPDFFSFPRVVAAMTADGGGHLLAKDRIYLGYQERAGLIEVISYNEAAARFEFQLVRNYLPQGKPETVYASRAVCTACHQNHGPFSRGNNGTKPMRTRALRLDSRRKTAGHASSCTESRFAAASICRMRSMIRPIEPTCSRWLNRIWRDACDSACRSQALQAALQYRLSQEQGFEATPAFALPLAQRFAAQWPSGLAIPNPDLPNRDPLAFADDPVRP